MLSFHRLTRSHELVAARAIGVSVWQFLLPASMLVIGVGGFTVLAFNPLAATLVARYESLDRTYLSSQSSQLAIAPGGWWFRQAHGDQELVLHARQMTASSTTLEGVVVFFYDGTGRFVDRVDAPLGRLLDGHWELEDAVRTSADGQREAQPRLRIATELTPDQIHESFARPESLSFWDLPAFIRSLHAVGFSAREHRLYWHGLLALPLVLCAMLLIGTSCSLRLVRRGGTGVLVAGGLAAGFLFYIFSDLVAAVGLSGRLPAALAAWTPAGVAVLLGMTTLLHIEDG
jgi:lipopolysaccharide export system permease protein